jgi:hypothetical protein
VLRNYVALDADVAGNVAYDSGTGQCIWNDPGLGVPSTSHRLSEGNLLGTFLGTSLSTPKVAHLAARILDRYGDATPNFLRALLVQSARFPEGFKDQDVKLIMRLCGFGVPDLDRALHCRPARATLFYEGEISMDEVQIFEHGRALRVPGWDHGPCSQNGNRLD